jgi:hypothetical protein
MRALIVYTVFYSTAFATFFTHNIYFLLIAPFAAMAVSIVLRMTGWPKEKP